MWDLPEFRPPAGGEGGPARRRGGGGGGRFSFTPYAGINHQPSFVDWQPIQPETPGPYEPTRFVEGRGGTRRAEAPVQPGGGGGMGRGGGAGGRQGRDGGPGGGGGAGRPGGGQQRPQGGAPVDPLEYFQEIARRVLGPNIGEAARGNIFGGVNTNFLDYGTPGWREDPTTGIMNTGGFPNPTPPARGPMEDIESYANRLHDLGFGMDDIMSMVGPSSGWGTGGVVRGPDGYQFANQETPTGMTMNPLGRPGEGMFGGAGGGGGGQTGTGPSATMEDFFNAANMGWLLR
jgi:hypothetical protein